MGQGGWKDRGIMSERCRTWQPSSNANEGKAVANIFRGEEEPWLTLCRSLGCCCLHTTPSGTFAATTLKPAGIRLIINYALSSYVYKYTCGMSQNPDGHVAKCCFRSTRTLFRPLTYTFNVRVFPLDLSPLSTLHACLSLFLCVFFSVLCSAKLLLPVKNAMYSERRDNL